MRQLSTAAGVGVGLTGVAIAGVGVWARRDVRRTLADERISRMGSASSGRLVDSPGSARATAELIRRSTIESSGGRTYAEIEPYVTGDGKPTADAALAAKHELTGEALENPAHALWAQSITLQTALMQAYMAFRLAELSVAVGAGLAATGVGLVAAGARREAPA